MSAAAADLFDRAEPAAPPDDVTRALEFLARSPPLWPIGAGRWLVIFERMEALAWRHDAEARAAGWSSMQMYGLHRHAPYARLDAMGAAWLLARRGDRVIAIDPEKIIVASAAGARLRLFRADPHPDSVLAWKLCRGTAKV
jgi:hypothetical protein